MRRDQRLDVAYEAARLYYDERRTMESIGQGMGLSRSTVSRLLDRAREDGLVRISLHPPGARRVSDLQEALTARYRVRVTVVPSATDQPEVERLGAVADAGARLVQSLAQPDSVVGLAWGTTIAAVAESLEPRTVPGLSIVQLNGAITADGSGLDYVTTVMSRAGRAWDARVFLFPVPAFFDHTSTRTALWQERSVQRVLDLQDQCELAVFGVGAFDAEVPSHVYSSGYLTEAELRSLREDGVVGDVCTVFLRADGSYAQVAMNDRSSGPSPDKLARIPRRVLIANGRRKALPLRAALRARVATDVVLDEQCAARLMGLG
jgi:deoxyribonucleoside regulator